MILTLRFTNLCLKGTNTFNGIHPARRYKMERFPLWRKLVYSSGSMGFSILDNIFGIYFIFFLLPPVETGMPELINNESMLGITLVGIIIILGRVVDSIADPLVAYWSDRTKSSLGRRRFFMLTGALPFALIAVLLFTLPDDHATTRNAVYAAVTLGIYFFMYTWYMTPYLALIPEITRSHDERIFVTVIQAVFLLIGAAVIMMGVPMIWHAFQATMSTAGSFKLSIAIVAGVGFIFAFAAALVVNEKKYSHGKPAELPLFESIKKTIANRVFLTYMIPVILYWFTFHMIRSTVAYYPMVLLHKPADFQTMLMVALFGSAALFFIVITILSKKVTNKMLMGSGLLAFALIMNITYFIDIFGDLSTTVALVQMFLFGYPVAILMTIPNAIVADISEVDAKMSGHNREAMFYGTQGLFMKVNYGIASAIVAGLFSVFGKDVANPLGVKLSGPVGGLFALVGFLIFFKYPQQWISDKLNEFRDSE